VEAEESRVGRKEKGEQLAVKKNLTGKHTILAPELVDQINRIADKITYHWHKANQFDVV